MNRSVEFDGSVFGDPVHIHSGTVLCALASYKGNSGTWSRNSRDAAFRREASGRPIRQQVIKFADVIDGLSQTIL